MTDTGREQILSHISANTQKKISQVFDRVDANKEFEFIFFSRRGNHMNKEKYILLLKYMRNMSKQKKFRLSQPERTLDVGYNSSTIIPNQSSDNKITSE